jgi:hypothetical protein
VLGAGRLGIDDGVVSAMAAGERSGNVVAPVANALFTDHLLAFELTSILLLVAVVGAVLLAQRAKTSLAPLGADPTIPPTGDRVAANAARMESVG